MDTEEIKQKLKDSPPAEWKELRDWILLQNTGKEGIMLNNLNALMRLLFITNP